MTLVAYTFLSNLGHWERGRWRGKNGLAMRHEWEPKENWIEKVFWESSLNAGDQISEPSSAAMDK